MLAAIHSTSLKYLLMSTPSQDTRVIQLTINHTLAVENNLLNTLTWLNHSSLVLQLDRNIE